MGASVVDLGNCRALPAVHAASARGGRQGKCRGARL